MPNIIKLVLSSLLQGKDLLQYQVYHWFVLCVHIPVCVTGSSLAAAMDFFHKLVALRIMAHDQVFELLTSAVYSPTPVSAQQQSSSSTTFVIHRQVC